MSALGSIRFAARTAAFAAYSSSAYAAFESEAYLRGGDREALLGPSLRRYGANMAYALGIRLHRVGFPDAGYFEGKDARGRGRVFVMNHRSALDIMVSLATVEGKLVSRADLATWPLVGPLAKRVGILFVDRESKRSSAQVMRQMMARIEAGVGIVIFPEGTTYAGDEVKEFKPGAFSVARRTGAEIIPIGIAHRASASSFDDESFLDHMRRNLGNSESHVGVAAGEPIVSEGRTQEMLAALCHAEVQRLVYVARSAVSP
jgi:lyso-ornithine lipid O-acyltransferase